MKFSLFLIGLFLVGGFYSSSDLTIAWFLLVLGVLTGVMSLFCYSDFKKVFASISIFHMCFGVFILFYSYSTDFDMLNLV